jgi:hypothetical protein
MLTFNKPLTSIRCPSERPHGIYTLCGHLLAVLDEDNNVILPCSDCQTFYKLTIKENQNVEMTPLPKNQRLKLINKLRVIV